MNCSYCQREFKEDQAQAACRGCPSGGGCNLIKCPYCGYETPREPGLIKKIRAFFKSMSGSDKPRPPQGNVTSH